MARSVGAFGGYKGRAIHWEPDKAGLLACASAGRPSGLRLYWSFGASGGMEIGEAVASESAAGEVKSAIPGWITLERTDQGARALVSKAWPAVRVHLKGNTVLWRTSGAKILGAVEGRPGELDLPVSNGRISEPWLVVFGHQGAEDAAVLLTFTRRLVSVARAPGGYLLTFKGAGALHAMPLEGIRRRRRGEAPLDHFIASARAWVSPLLAFPTEAREAAAVEGGRVRIEASFSHEVLTDDYQSRPEILAPFPPINAQAALEGYPVDLPHGLIRDSAQLSIPTFYGPLWLARGASYTYAIPAAVCCEALPTLRRRRGAWARPIRAELSRLVDEVGDPPTDYMDRGLRVVSFLAQALPELNDAQKERARRYAQACLRSVVSGLRDASEPITDQAWWTVGSTWRSHFREEDPPCARDNERFDSEFYNGQALAAIDAAASLDPPLAPDLFEGAKKLYRYDQIFWDWATGSVLTQATGEGSNIDGVQFAWEGMVAMARVARRAGDAELWTDAMYRAARQELALFAMWHHAKWMKQWDYAVGHVSKGRIRPEDLATDGPIDAFVEEYGAAALEFCSFWQCSNFLFYDNRPLYELYRRHGLLERVRAIEYEIMPRLHPRFLDGDAVDPHGENGQEKYGAAWTAAHLHARAALFGHDPTELFEAYRRTRGTAAASTWYRMQLPEIAGPLMLALLEEPGARREGEGEGEPDPNAIA